LRLSSDGAHTSPAPIVAQQLPMGSSQIRIVGPFLISSILTTSA
jgi:hypothetical protein